MNKGCRRRIIIHPKGKPTLKIQERERGPNNKESQMKEKSVNLIKLTPIEKFYTQQIIRPQDVFTYYKVEEKTLKQL
jgi:hypothetical protein